MRAPLKEYQIDEGEEVLYEKAKAIKRAKVIASSVKKNVWVTVTEVTRMEFDRETANKRKMDTNEYMVSDTILINRNSIR